MGGKYTEAQKKAAAKYQKEKTSLIGVRVTKEKRALYEAHAKEEGVSLSSFIIDAVDKKIESSDR